MAKQGYANCTASFSRATFHPFWFKCDRFKEADAELVQARMEWRKRA